MNDIIEQLKIDEGFSAIPYPDTEGYLTVGYGINLDAGISEAEADRLLRMRVNAIDIKLDDTFHWYTHLDSARKGVIINMVYNMGLPRFKGTPQKKGFDKMIAALVIQDYATAADEMLDSKWARQVGDRAKRLAEVMRHG